MRFLAGSILIVAFLDGLLSVPLINGDNERQTSKRWGKSFGIGLQLGLEGGIKDGVAHLKIKNHIGFDIRDYSDETIKELEHPTSPTPPPSDYSAVNYPNQYYPANGSPHNMYGGPQFFPPYLSQFEYPSQYPFEYPSQYPFEYPSQYPFEYPTQYPFEYLPEYPSEYPLQYPSEYPLQFDPQYT